MSVMKEVLLKWTEAVEKFEMKNFEKARQKFEEFGDTAKLLYNSGICLMILEEREEAIIKFSKAIDKDSYFAAAYFQRGRLQFQKDDFEGALEDYQDCYEKLRNNTHIDYAQLGLDYVLQECYVVFNIALCFLVLGDYDRGLRYFEQALDSSRDAKIQPDTYKIEEALRRGEDAIDMSPYDISTSLIFRPQKDNVKNAKKVNYLGKSKVVAGSDSKDSFAGFSGRQKKEMSLGRDYRKKKKPQETVPPLPEFPKRNTSRRTSSVSRIDVQPRPKRVATRSSSMSTLRTRKTSDSSNYPKRPFDSPSERSSKSTRPFDSPKDRVGPFDFPDKFRQALSSTEKATRPFESLIDYPPTPPISSGSISSYDEDMFRIKAHIKSSVRILKIPITSNFDDLLIALEEKFKLEVRVEFIVDGERVEMGDDDDFDEAIELSVGNKIEIYCEEL